MAKKKDKNKTVGSEKRVMEDNDDPILRITFFVSAEQLLKWNPLLVSLAFQRFVLWARMI